MKKLCPTCKTEKPLDDFYKHRGCKDGVQTYCKPCFRAYQSTGERKKQRRIYRFNSEASIKRRDYHRSWQMMKKYGITLEQYNDKLVAQAHCCAICRKHQMDCHNGLYVDHDHGTKEVRMLLCRECNAGIGLFKESPDLLRAAAKYLEMHSQTTLHLIKGEG